VVPRRAKALVVLAIVALGTGCGSEQGGAPRVDPALSVRLIATPAEALRRCERAPRLRPACPRRIPFVGPPPGYDVALCRVGRPECAGLTWDDFHIQRAGSSGRPPGSLHIAIFAGDLESGHAFRFCYPTTHAQQLRDGLFGLTRTTALFFGSATWAGKRGALILAPPNPLGGTQGDHLVFRWRERGVDYALGLHAWEPLTEAEATLREIMESTPRAAPR
jgi:hypothetical protein